MSDRRQKKDRRKEDRRKGDRRDTKQEVNAITISFKAFIIIITITVLVLVISGIGIVKYLFDKQEESFYDEYYLNEDEETYEEYIYEDEEAYEEYIYEDDYEQYEEEIEV